MKVGYKVWLDNKGKAFGDGPYELLKRVDETRSLHRAAKEMRMAYSKAWRLIGAMEKRLGFPLIERQVGGLSGGGSLVTIQGKNLLKQYEGFRKDVNASLENIYRKHFHTPFGDSNPRPTRGRRSRKCPACAKGK
ncbi:MAG: winged helix-turn-helix domain-containing protein [Thermodesulfobacteriota bacterium]